MRKLVVVNIVSVDGFTSGPHGDLSDMPFGPGFSEYNLERLRNASTLLLGRKSFEGFRAYWPSIQDDPAQPAGEREISRLNNAIDKVVVTETLDDAQLQWSPSRIVRPARLADEVSKLKDGDGKDIIVFGSHQLWNELLTMGLVDELHIMVGAGTIGSGVRAFETDCKARLRLMDARQIDDTGLVLLAYAVETNSA